MSLASPGTHDTLASIGVDDSLESLLAHGTPGVAAVYACIVLLVVGGLGAAALTKVDQSVRAMATISPTVERQALRSPGDGRVVGLRVQLGGRVRAGDTVLVLDAGGRGAAALRARRALGEQHQLTYDLHRLMAGGDDPTTWPTELLSLARTRASARRAALEWRHGSSNVTRAEQVHGRSVELGRRGYAERAEVDAAEIELLRAKDARALALEQHRADWSTQLATSVDRVRELESEIAVHAGEASARVVIAPVDGTIEDLAPLTLGTLLRAGDPIGLLSPDGPLTAISLVPPRDAAHLRVGMTARLVVEGYDAQEWGSVAGEVTAVAGDFSVAEGNPVFRVSIRTLSTEVRRADGRTSPIRKGLRCQVRFVVGRRTLGSIARRRAREWLDPPTTSAR